MDETRAFKLEKFVEIYSCGSGVVLTTHLSILSVAGSIPCNDFRMRKE